MAVLLMTGANGFVGQAMRAQMVAQDGLTIRPVVRPANARLPGAVEMDITPESNWMPHLQDVDCVVHLAARVHQINDQVADPLSAYRKSNTEATLHLARCAARAGVRRFIFLSSIKVHGEATTQHAFAANDTPHPQDPYGISKWEAEQGLASIARETGMQVVIIRPPLVYGPGVKANFLQLMRWVARGVPLPLASVQNRRSMVYVGNLVDLILRCIADPAAAGQTLLVSDGTDVSTARLIACIAEAMGRRARLLPCPPALLRLAARMLGKGAVIDRLLGSLQVDISATTRELGWQPPFSFEAGIAATVAAFQHEAGMTQ